MKARSKTGNGGRSSKLEEQNNVLGHKGLLKNMVIKHLTIKAAFVQFKAQHVLMMHIDAHAYVYGLVFIQDLCESFDK